MESTGTKGSRPEIKEHVGYHTQTVSHTVVEYILHPDTTYKIFLGFTYDFNDSGFSLYTTKLLEKGQEIIVRSSFPYTCRKAVVCWVEQYDSFYYKVGLEFTV
jgi:hypothetical protein